MKTIEEARREGIKTNEIYNGDALELMRLIPNEFIDLVLTDPPYGMLDHKLDRRIDWKAISEEWARILKRDAMIVMFGRGTQLYRWAAYLEDLGFDFKEEIIWDKKQPSGGLTPLLRVHELIVVYARGKKRIKKVRVPYEEVADAQTMFADLRRIASALQGMEKDDLIKYIQNDFIKDFNRARHLKHEITMSNVNNCARGVSTFEKVRFGAVETSIISITREHYTMEHPTQKPLRLIERLLNITSDEGDLVLDLFLGSGTTAVAAKKLGRNYIGFEILEEYCRIAEKRLQLTPSSIFAKGGD
jgi:site-specific DNA-methyltransferase (adenine-specific)